MSYWDSCPFQQMLEVKSNLKVTLVSFKIISFVRNTRPTISFLYYKIDMKNYPSKSGYHLKRAYYVNLRNKVVSSNETEKKK